MKSVFRGKLELFRAGGEQREQERLSLIGMKATGNSWLGFACFTLQPQPESPQSPVKIEIFSEILLTKPLHPAGAEANLPVFNKCLPGFFI